MFNLMRKHHKKFIILKNLTPRTENNKNLKKEVLINAADPYNSLYYIYKIKYNKKINSWTIKNKIKLDYKKIRFSDDYLYSFEKNTRKARTTKINISNKTWWSKTNKRWYDSIE